MDLLSLETARWIFAAWFLFLGGAVGSFLNVVVYRLPAGMNIAWPGSHCPNCKRAIRAYDNFPVLAWLWLRGRCRDCRRPISARYPLVEAVTAGLFLLLLIVEVYHHGGNLPLRPPARQPYPPGQCLAICGFHLGLLCTLLVAGLMCWDNKPPSRSLYVPLLLAALVAPAFWPWLHPLAAGPEVAESPRGGAMDSLLGMLIGYFLGQMARWLGVRFAVMNRRGGQIGGEALVIGAVLGWQAVFFLVPLALLLEELARMAGLRWTILRRLQAAVWILPLTLAWILAWFRLAIWLRLG